MWQSNIIAQRMKSLVRTHVYYFVYRYSGDPDVIPKHTDLQRHELTNKPGIARSIRPTPIEVHVSMYTHALGEPSGGRMLRRPQPK
jgi:hypothetical protein